MRRANASFAIHALMLSLVVACGTDATRTPMASEPLLKPGGVPAARGTAALVAVRDGNAQLVANAPALVPPGAPLAPFVEARLYAIGSVAMHDALNAIVPRYARYADTGPLVPDADPATAALTAARDAMRGAVPAAEAAVDAWYEGAMAARADADGRAAGASLGARVAAAILSRRAADGTAGGGVAPYTPGASPGDYQFTFPFNTPGFDFFGTGGFADASVWGVTVTPFVVQTTRQFRAPPPYGAATNADAVRTAAYTSDFDEVKALGCDGCASRTPEQTEIARFWVENSPTGWNRIARIVAEQRQLDAWETARLLALVQMAEFDAYASNLESRYHYGFWRPVTAIAAAASDGNAATTPADGWQVLVFPTPPVPDYPSAHAAAGGAAAAVIEAVVPGRGPRITMSSGSLPGVSRTFDDVASAAYENADSRIFVGYHFRHATRVGLTQGRAIGTFVASRALTKR